jgi:3-hydroxyisobutyrate dehydrogenase-like beta-hydroxyacid dehydrogenase
MRLGYIGLGNMGGGMAKCLAAAGHDVLVHDARREAAAPQIEAGAKWADTPAKVAMAMKAGVDLEVTLKGVSEGAVGLGKTIALFPKIVFGGEFKIEGMGMPLSYAHKDLSIATQVGREFKVPMPLSQMVEDDMVAAMNDGLGHKEHTVFLTRQEKRAGIEMRTKKAKA